MANFAGARGVLAPLAVSVATAAFLIGGTMVAPGYAQSSSHPAKSVAAKEATSTRSESVDQRIAQLHSKLKITSNEEEDWKTVADTMRSNAQDIKNLIDQTREQSPKAKRTALEDLQTYQKFAQAHAEGLQKLTAAFATLYDAMPPEQKANADEVFRSFERRPPNAGQRG
jgi:glutamine synthetase adenylyltransferase